MRPVQMSSEGRWDKQALVCAVEGRREGGGGEEWGLQMGDSKADGLPSYIVLTPPFSAQL